MNCPKCGQHLDKICFDLVFGLDTPPEIIVVCGNCEWIAYLDPDESDFVEVKTKAEK